MGIEVLNLVRGPTPHMKLSDAAQQLLTQLCMAKEAYLFGERDGTEPFKLKFGKESLPAPRRAVDELSKAGCLNRTTTGAGRSVFISLTVSDEGRSKFRGPSRTVKDAK
jgi:hypothetical protein